MQLYSRVALLFSMLDVAFLVIAIGVTSSLYIPEGSYLRRPINHPIPGLYLIMAGLSVVSYFMHVAPFALLNKEYDSLYQHHLEDLPNSVHQALAAVDTKNDNVFLTLNIGGSVPFFWVLAGTTAMIIRESYGFWENTSQHLLYI